MMKRIAVFIFSFLFINCFSQQVSKSWMNLNYASDSLNYHLLDIYLPEVQKKIYPAVIVIYGSAWFGNNLKRTGFTTLGKPLLDMGFAVITPNHRASTDATFPAQIHDIKAVIRFIRANAETYQIDTSFIGITGYSSGGHLASLAGTSGSVKEYTVGTTTYDLEGTVGPYLSYASSVDAVVDWFGPTDFLVMNSCGGTGHNDSSSPESSLIGGPIQANPDQCALANPITYIDADDPPFLILHGDADPLVPYCNSEMFCNALQQANVSSQFVLVPDAQHGPGLFEEPYFKMMADFFTAQLSETKVGIENGFKPEHFSVSQNYPNPFNPCTTIRFTLPGKLLVTLTVFDTLGQKVTTLVSGEMLPPGTHACQWNAHGLSSGLYFYRLQAGSYIETKKLVFLG